MEAPEKNTRRLEDYLDGFFVKQLSEKRSYNLPEPDFTLLAGCSKTETAKDIQVEKSYFGAFSRALIEVLDSSAGEISYKDLLSNVRVNLKQTVENQTPVLESSSTLSPTRLFLSRGEETDPPLSYSVYYLEGKWIVEFGVFEGIHLGVSTNDLQFEIYQQGRLIGNAGASLVNFESSELSMGFTADPDVFYQAKVIRNNSEPLAIFLSGQQEEIDRFRRRAERRNVIELRFEENSTQSNYELNFTGQQITLKQGSRTIGTVSGGDLEKYFYGFLGTLQHIAFWERVRELKNPGSVINPVDVGLILEQLDKDGKSLPTSGQELDVSMPGKSKKVSFRLQIDPILQQEFHYAVLLLAPDFSIKCKKTGIASGKLIQEEFAVVFMEAGPHFCKILFSSAEFNWSLLEKPSIETEEPVPPKTR